MKTIAFAIAFAATVSSDNLADILVSGFLLVGMVFCAIVESPIKVVFNNKVENNTEETK